jgi:hypothetical protein
MLKTETELGHNIEGQLIKSIKVKEYICQVCGEKTIRDTDYDKSQIKAMELYCAKNHKPITDLIDLNTYERIKMGLMLRNNL